MVRFAALSLIFFSTQAFASGSSVFQYMSERLTCNQAKSIVSLRGAVILHYGNDLFDRVVKNNGFCMPGERTEPMLAPTRDNGFCNVGFVCDNRTGGNDSSDGGSEP